MFASKTLTERNNDPYPWVAQSGNRVSRDYGFLRGSGVGQIQMNRDPRPEFQHGKLEANPILVASRDYTNDVKSYWVNRLTNGDLPAGVSATTDQISHAHRVLTLWLAVFA